MKYTIYTDGAYSQKNSEGAFAYIIIRDGVVVATEATKIYDSTNNRAELMAIMFAVERLPDDATDVTVISDSMYALNTLRGKWGRNANKDLFREWDNDILSNRRNVNFEWLFVKGHSGDYYNEECDRMCNGVLGYDPSEEYSKYRSVKR